MASQDAAESATRRTLALCIKTDELTAKIETTKRLIDEAERELAKDNKPAGFDVAYKKLKDLVAQADLTKAVFEHITKAFNNLPVNSISTEVHEAFKACNALAAELIPTEALKVLKPFEVKTGAATVGRLELFPDVEPYKREKFDAEDVQVILEKWQAERKASKDGRSSTPSSKTAIDDANLALV